MKAKKSTWLPLLLLVYLMVMAYVGHHHQINKQQQRQPCGFFSFHYRLIL